jgi:signal transduction histidine kinase
MPDGTAKYVAINSRKIYGEDGELQYLGAVQDVTERRVAGEKLRRSEVLLAEGQRLSRTGSFMWIPATDELVWSAEMYRITAIDPATPAARDLFDTRVHPDDAEALKDMQARAAAGAPDYDGREYEFRLLMPDHSIKYVIINSHMVHGADGQVQYVGALQDVTDRHAAEEALANARSELAHVARVTSLGGLTASITHEVSQPLSGIITNASTCQRMLAADPPNIEGARETVRRILRDGGRASDVITRLRGLFSKKAPVVEPVDLNETTREVIALSSTELQRNGVSLQQEFSDNLPPVEGDRVQLQQVILNLLLNAADAMSAVYDRPRQLTVRTDRDEHGQVRVSMRDTGVGFDPQTVGKLFEAFFTTKGNGMGIGLSVSRSIIEGHNGRLWAVANDGPGATFSFSIPCKSEGDVNVRRAIAS